MKKKVIITLLVLLIIVLAAVLLFKYLDATLPTDNFMLKPSGSVTGRFIRTCTQEEGYGFFIETDAGHVFSFGYAPGVSVDGIEPGDLIKVSYTYDGIHSKAAPSHTSHKVKLIEEGQG